MERIDGRGVMMLINAGAKSKADGAASGVLLRRATVWIAATVFGGVWVFWAIRWWQLATQGDFNAWSTGDWLINYAGGPVRRGLLGAVLESVVPSGTSIIVVTTLFQLATLGTLFLLALLLYLKTDRSVAWLMAILSPAAMLFWPLSVLQEGAGPRKEILGLVALAVLALGFDRRHFARYAWISFGLLLVASLAHEANAVLFPIFVYLTWQSPAVKGHLRLRATLSAAFCLAGLVPLGLAIRYSGNQESVDAICVSWVRRAIPVEGCSGALSALMLSRTDVVDHFQNVLFPTYFGYLPVLALALIPLFTVRFLPRQWRAGLLTLVCLAPLFLLAWDYGRWISLGVTAMTLISLATLRGQAGPPPMRVPIVVALAYCTLWGIYGYSTDGHVLADGVVVSWLKALLPSGPVLK